jgi:ligand-binding SRPBCC domain-containing protein
MQTHRFRDEIRIAHPVDRVFPFFASAANLERITPPQLRFRILTPDVAMGKGALIRYSLRLFGVPFRWVTEITRWDPPHEFVDVQLSGPYRQWIHTHRFRADGDGTLMEDTVDYALPLQPIGELALPVVRWQIRRIFAHRAEVIPRLV